MDESQTSSELSASRLPKAPPPVAREATLACDPFEIHVRANPLANGIGCVLHAVVNADGDQRIVGFDTAAEEMFSRAATEVVGQPVQRVLLEGLQQDSPPPEIRVGVTSSAARLTHRVAALTGLHANGRRFPIAAVISQLESGGKSVFTAILRENTDARHALGRQRTSERGLIDFFAHSPIGLMCVTPDGKVEQVNDAQLRLLDEPSNDVVGRFVADLYLNREATDLLLDRVARGETVRDFHLHAVTESGLRHLLVDANGVWERGMLVRSQWYVRDITARVRLETELLTIAENERQRIGQDLHDDVCQQLVGIEMMAGAIAVRLPTSAPDLAEEARRISFHLRVAVERTRELARGLAPSLPRQPEGLMTALQDLAERTTKIFQRECRFECPRPVLSVDETKALHLVRIAQEAVSNAIRHGQARHITIKLFANGADLVLGVSDDGNGRMPDPERRHGMGLRVMQYRSGAIGGTLAIQRVPNHGTSVICTVKAGVRPDEGTK